MGKSLLDVQRELRIKASYIAAIENCDPDAFDTPGFIAGYVRSYARYLGHGPGRDFRRLLRRKRILASRMACRTKASVGEEARRSLRASPGTRPARDPFSQPHVPFTPANEGDFCRGSNRGAVGSMLVLIALIGGIGYGGWTVLKEVQRVQVAPVEQTPIVLSDLDPLAAARQSSTGRGGEGAASTARASSRRRRTRRSTGSTVLRRWTCRCWWRATRRSRPSTRAASALFAGAGRTRHARCRPRQRDLRDRADAGRGARRRGDAAIRSSVRAKA